MPREVHERLVREGRRKGLRGEALKRYVYGTLMKLKKKRKEKN